MEKLNKELLKHKTKRIVSSEEALKDVEPFLTEEEIAKIIESGEKIVIS